jgi:uncharacterized protein (DUF885 family)
MTTTTERSQAEVAALAVGYWDDVLRLNPLLATQVGDDRFDDRLPEIGGAAREDALTASASALRQARSIDRNGLSMVERTTLDVIEAHARAEFERLSLGHDLLEAVDHLYGPGTLLDRILEVQPLQTSGQVRRFRLRLAALPAYLDGATELMREGIARRFTAPAVVVERTLHQVDRLLGAAITDWPAVASVPRADREATAGVVGDLVRPAYAAYRQALADYLPRAREQIGVIGLHDGEALYASRIRAWTSLAPNPEEVHAVGLRELEAIRSEQEEIAHQGGHRSVEAAKEAARDRTRSTSREEIRDAAARMVERGWETSQGWFGRLPRENCAVRPIELGREDDILDYYIPSTSDGSRPGTFYVSTRPGRSLYRLATTVYHESSPGHHLQVALEQEAADRPPIRRFTADLVGGAFAEGWGLYAERLSDELGLFADDDERLGMLELQALRAARLVVDTGIHALGWDRERAIGVLEEAWADDRAEAEIEIDRYIALPGQALCYTLGQLEIRRWRDEATAGNDGREALRTFHDRLLELGSLPLPALERELLGQQSTT